MPNYLGWLEAVLAPAGVIGMAHTVPVGQPNDGLPTITWQVIDSQEVESLSGYSALTRTTMQISVWDVSYDNAAAVRDTVVVGLRGRSGTYGSLPGPTIVLDYVTNFRYRELYDGERELHQLILRVDMWWADS